jgi:hypothetical protein
MQLLLVLACLPAAYAFSQAAAAAKGAPEAYIPYVSNAGEVLPSKCYTSWSDGMRTCKVFTGTAQLNGRHGYSPISEDVAKALLRLSEAGLTSFEVPDVGPAQELVGLFRQQVQCKALLTLCPRLHAWQMQIVQSAGTSDVVHVVACTCSCEGAHDWISLRLQRDLHHRC